MTATGEPYQLGNAEGPAYWFLDTLIAVKATGDQTGGALGLIEQQLPAGTATSYHVHRNEDEYWYVLEGEITFVTEGRRIEASTGSFVFMPRNIPHGLRAKTAARMLVFSTPASFVDFAIVMGEPAGEPRLPAIKPAIDATRRSLSQKYHIEILGPLPE